MPYPKNSPGLTRLIPSRQLIPGSLINDMNDANYSFQALTALGTLVTDPALINAANVEILSGSANNAGVKLPPALPGASINILNNSLNTTKIYPNGATDVIQNGATGYAAVVTAVTMATLVSATFFCIKAGFWQVSKAGGP